jgi:hypothetical protein
MHGVGFFCFGDRLLYVPQEAIEAVVGRPVAFEMDVIAELSKSKTQVSRTVFC